MVFLGCVKVENITPSAEFGHNTPGFCYSACNKTEFIGVNEKKVRGNIITVFIFIETFKSHVVLLISNGNKMAIHDNL
jgi:hypothetical protein